MSYEEPQVIMQEVNAVAVSIPAYMATSVPNWFKLAEVNFELSNISQSSTKFLHVFRLLPMDVLEKIPHNVFLSRDYDAVKSIVLELFERSKPELFDKLISSATMTGKPSEYLNELINIAVKFGVEEEKVRHRFLQNIPNLAPILASVKDLTLTQLGKLADDLVSCMPFALMTSNQERNQNQYQSSNNQQQYQSSDNHTQYQPSMSDNSQIPIGIRPYKANQKPKVCRSHLYYADKAKTCKPWCKFPKKPGMKTLPSSRSASPAPDSDHENYRGTRTN